VCTNALLLLYVTFCRDDAFRSTFI